jgi:hypothetical protein
MHALNTFPKFQLGVFTPTTRFMINTSILCQLRKGVEVEGLGQAIFVTRLLLYMSKASRK